jgi:galactonate dehydratase
MKVAARAEVNHVGIVPHNQLSPGSTVACVQIAACSPHVALQEYPSGEDGRQLVVGALTHAGEGYLIIPDLSGSGVVLAPDAAVQHPNRPRR